jgi:hypothetical protein
VPTSFCDFYLWLSQLYYLITDNFCSILKYQIFFAIYDCLSYITLSLEIFCDHFKWPYFIIVDAELIDAFVHLNEIFFFKIADLNMLFSWNGIYSCLGSQDCRYTCIPSLDLLCFLLSVFILNSTFTKMIESRPLVWRWGCICKHFNDK